MNKYTEIINEDTKLGGRNIFKSFLKMITALGGKDNKPDWEEIPTNYLIYFFIKDVDLEKLKLITSRYKSLNMFSDMIEYIHNTSSIYFGIRNDLVFEYGFKTDKSIPVGKFRINKSNFNWLLILDSPSANSLKKSIIDLDINSLYIFGKIKRDSYNFTPGRFSKKSIPIIESGVFTFSYYGLGKWDNGNLNAEDFEILRNNFKKWTKKFDWSNKILINLTAGDFWVNYNFKIK